MNKNKMALVLVIAIIISCFEVTNSSAKDTILVKDMQDYICQYGDALPAHDYKHAINQALTENSTKASMQLSKDEPTIAPTKLPTKEPTVAPTLFPTKEPTVAPTHIPTAAPTIVPTHIPTAVPTSAPTKTPQAVLTYKLVSKYNSYKAGGLKKIKYHSVKKEKVYHIDSYVTDSVKLVMSKPSTYKIYGASSKKEIKYYKVNKKGIVTYTKKDKSKKGYVVVKATAKGTGEKQYIYIFFDKKLACTNFSKLKIYVDKHEFLKFNYKKGRLAAAIGDKDIISFNGKGKVTAKKPGKTYIIVRVKDSKKNYITIPITVKNEPWIVKDKDSVYSYTDMLSDIYKLKSRYPGRFHFNSIGTTADNRQIWCIRIGNVYAGKKVMINSTIHAREWKNTQIIMRQTEELLRNYRDYKKKMANRCVYVIPMVNPDGASISQYGPSAIRNTKLRKKVKKIGNFKHWKNNARGVNLNNNFPAGFKKSKTKKPHSVYFCGKKAASEPETKAMINFVKTHRLTSVINLHSTGSIIYWDYDVNSSLHDKNYRLALKIRDFNGYRLMPRNSTVEAHGGFADWLNYKMGISSVTVETGTVPCPLPHSQFKSIYKKNNEMFLYYMTKY